LIGRDAQPASSKAILRKNIRIIEITYLHC
jgi:hypothetical protein